MHFPTPAFVAATLAATLAPAQAQAPTALAAPLSRVASGGVTETIEAAAAEALLVAAVPRNPEEVLSDAAPLPEERAPARAASRPAAGPGAVHLAQASPRASAPRAPAPAASRRSGTGPAPSCTSVSVDPPMTLTLGKSQVIRLPFPAARLIIGGSPGNRAGQALPAEPLPAPPGVLPPGAAAAMQRAGQPQPRAGNLADGVAETDVTLLSPTELFFLGRRPGSMNVVLQGNDGRCLVKDLVVTMDPGTLQAQIADLMPEETGVKIRAAESSLVLTGTVNDAVKLDQILSLAGSYADHKKVVNLLRVTAPHQVLLEVKIAEVSKTLLDRFGLDFSRVVTSANGVRSAIISGIVGGAPGILGRFNPNLAGGVINGNAASVISSDSAAATASLSTASRGATLLGLDMTRQDGVIRVLAEPNIMSISGQPASFLSGGKIFIPVAQSSLGSGGTTITLEEKEFGVGLKFTPTVLDGRINLKIVSEVSELSQTGTPFTTVAGVTAVLPSLSTRRVDTTVQLADGQSFAVAGLIKSNITEALNKFPGLGDAPVLGALFRSTEFQNDKTELMFVVTPRLVRPVIGAIPLPTDNHVVPDQTDVILRGSGESATPPNPPAQPRPVPVPSALVTPLPPAAPAPNTRP